MNTSLLGAEISIKDHGHRRRRGYVTADHEDSVEISLYPPNSFSKFEDITCDRDVIRVLKSPPPTGFKAIDFLNSDDKLHFSIRLRQEDFRLLKQLAREKHISLDELVNQTIQEQVEKYLQTG